VTVKPVAVLANLAQDRITETQHYWLIELSLMRAVRSVEGNAQNMVFRQ